MKFIIQQEIMKGNNPDKSWDYTSFSANDNWREIILNLENDDNFYVCFVTIPVAFFIMNNTTKLASGLTWPTIMLNPYDPNNILNFNVYNTVLSELSLNYDSGIITLEQIKTYNKHEKFFVRPISPWKSFTGFDSSVSESVIDYNSIKNLYNIPDHTLCAISSYKKIDPLEYRCYYIEGELVTCSAYGWDNPDYNASIPCEVLDIACMVGEKLELYGDAYVIDIGIFDGKPYVIELNAIPTSGWYDGMNVNKLLSKMEQIYNV
jgi:hypothetical protein